MEVSSVLRHSAQFSVGLVVVFVLILGVSGFGWSLVQYAVGKID